jgi:hypothetical protein
MDQREREALDRALAGDYSALNYLEFEVIHKNVVQAVRDLAPEGLAP